MGDSYPLPEADENIDSLGGECIFLTRDDNFGYL